MESFDTASYASLNALCFCGELCGVGAADQLGTFCSVNTQHWEFEFCGKSAFD
jgi:hypothetical protein